MNSDSDNNVEVILSLGSNLGDRILNIQNAVKLFIENGIINEPKISHVYQTEPVGVIDQAKFINIVVAGYTRFSPEYILFLAKSIEYLAGRKLRQRWHSRELDIDIIFYGNIKVSLPKLVIPHIEAVNRKFVLIPLSDIFPQFVHPITNKSIEALIRDCPDNTDVNLIQDKLF